MDNNENIINEIKDENVESNNNVDITDEKKKKKKSRKTKTAIAAFVLLLGVGVMGNWYYQNSDLSSTIEPLISSNQSKTLGEAEFVDATTEIKDTKEESEYFSKARLNRQTARDNTLETLQKALDGAGDDEKVKAEMTDKIAKVSSYIDIENKIETLVTSKGVKSCIAVVNEDGTRVDVIVDCEDLNDNLIMQIKAIATEQLNCDFKNVSIIQAS